MNQETPAANSAAETQLDHPLKNRLLIACAVAREAGALQKRRFLDRENMIFKFKGPQDYLTATDGEVEKLVRNRLLSAEAKAKSGRVQ